VPSRSSRLDDAIAISDRIRVDIGREVRGARRTQAISQREAGARVGMSHAQFGRIERALVRHVTVDQLSRASSAVGLQLAARAMPGAGATVDAGQLGILSRFRSLLPPGTPFDTEVPLPSPGDLRAWDGLFTLQQVLIAVEAESRLQDLQAQERRWRLKLRDGGVELLILAVADTRWNRTVLDEHREALRGAFPLDGRQLRPLLRAGRAPEASGIIVF
jgi:transcriptional regulator with XRE-family HTH domain